MFKKLVLIAVVLTTLLVNASPAFAQDTYYVDTAYTGTEVGTMAQPFKTLDKAIAAAQNDDEGGYIYIRGANGAWVPYGYIYPVNPPYTGAPLSSTALFVLFGLASLILVAAGWFLRRRSLTFPSRA